MSEIQTAINYIKIQIKNNEDKLMDSSIKQAYKTILLALKKQVAVKVIKRKHSLSGCICTICLAELNGDEKYCKFCGQKIDWS
ncbi:MAG: hypothetical protein K0Q53_142 [Massilibacillus sp.]|jgi:hypothetical protein|nr:hypothetical protein [Massilibacillus sp.]